MDTDRTPELVRVIVRGWAYLEGQLDNRKEARAMLLNALASTSWPTDAATLVVTPGGFIRTRLPRDYDGGRGWKSKNGDLPKLIPHAEAAVKAVVSGDVLKLVRSRARFLTIGVDLNIEVHKEERLQDNHRCRSTCPATCTHAELVAILDTNSGTVVRWTGKSYPVDSQQHTLVHVTDLGSHLLHIGSERLLVLGCHDLFMFIDRGRKSLYAPTPKETRRHRMRKLARKFKPTMILHHPHATYSPQVWGSAWGATRSLLPTARVWASGIAFCGNPEPRRSWKPWQTLDATRSATASQAWVHDVVIDGCGR
ncbi:MAG: hypothetical protein OXH52_07450 [Gammaproteobacteria bacterium]|nr:hypothetical protein [Gammaproteobacteria bacterium]